MVFASFVQGGSSNMSGTLSIVCALINRYQKPIAKSKPEDIDVGEKILSLLNQKNKIQLVNNSYTMNFLQ